MVSTVKDQKVLIILKAECFIKFIKCCFFKFGSLKKINKFFCKQENCSNIDNAFL